MIVLATLLIDGRAKTGSRLLKPLFPLYGLPQLIDTSLFLLQFLCISLVKGDPRILNLSQSLRVAGDGGPILNWRRLYLGGLSRAVLGASSRLFGGALTTLYLIV